MTEFHKFSLSILNARKIANDTSFSEINVIFSSFRLDKFKAEVRETTSECIFQGLLLHRRYHDIQRRKYVYFKGTTND